MGITFKDVRKIALSLGNVEEGTSYGTAAFKSGGKLLARIREDGGSLVIGTTFEKREEMMAAEPDVYHITEHYRNYPWVLVRLSRANADAVRDLLKRALRLAAAKTRRTPRKVPSKHSRS